MRLYLWKPNQDSKLYSSQVNFICIAQYHKFASGLYNLYSIQHPLQYDPLIGWGKKEANSRARLSSRDTLSVTAAHSAQTVVNKLAEYR